MKGIFFVICMCFVSFGVSAQVSESAFVNPENKYKPVPLWFWNNATVNENELLDQFRQMIRKDGYGGCAILPFGQDFKPEYLSDDYFNLYSKIIEEAKKLDVHMSLYDGSHQRGWGTSLHEQISGCHDQAAGQNGV